MLQNIKIGAPLAPGNNATVTLFDSTNLFPGGLQAAGIGFVTIDFTNLDQASAAAGLKGYKSVDRGANWREDDFGGVLGVQIPAGDTIVKVYVGSAEHAKITFTAGATGPSAWYVTVVSSSGKLIR
jgi:hypothetical protein